MVGFSVKCFYRTSPMHDTTAVYEGTHQEQSIQTGLNIDFMDLYKLPLPVNINWRNVPLSWTMIIGNSSNRLKKRISDLGSNKS